MARTIDGVMPATVVDLRAIASAAFDPAGPMKIGAEVEWLVVDLDDLERPIPASMTSAAAAGALPAGGHVTVEPGGQIELVTLPASDPGTLVAAIEADTTELVDRFARVGLRLVTLGLDPLRAPLRTLDDPRYAAMERFFEARTPAGVQMMTQTASIQINIGFGQQPAAVWRRAHTLTPMLAAVFANSPTGDGTSTGAASRRQRIWAATDPSRTRPVAPTAAAWGDYALDAQVMLRADPASGDPVPQLEDLSMATWLDHADGPSEEELRWHFRTLFPPVRPRGWLELRMIDALPAVGRRAALGTVWALLTDNEAGERAASACAEVADLWGRGLRDGCDDADVATLSATCLELAAASLTSFPTLAAACRTWLDRTTPDDDAHDPVALVTRNLEPGITPTRPA